MCVYVLSAKTAGCRVCESGMLLESVQVFCMNLLFSNPISNIKSENTVIREQPMMTIISSSNNKSIIGTKHAGVETSARAFVGAELRA